jgi:hypothetical protein
VRPYKEMEGLITQALHRNREKKLPVRDWLPSRS